MVAAVPVVAAWKAGASLSVGERVPEKEARIG
jgi:hypothetical protein